MHRVESSVFHLTLAAVPPVPYVGEDVCPVRVHCRNLAIQDREPLAGRGDPELPYILEALFVLLDLSFANLAARGGREEEAGSRAASGEEKASTAREEKTDAAARSFLRQSPPPPPERRLRREVNVRARGEEPTKKYKWDEHLH